jgi:thiamine biosynthesis lipoprotein
MLIGPKMHARNLNALGSAVRAVCFVRFTRLAMLLVGCTMASTGFAPTCLTPTAAASEASLSRYEFSEPHMGVTFRIVLYAADQLTANKVSAAAFARIQRLDDLLSDYDPHSELSQLSDTAGSGRPVPVRKELWFVLHQAQAVSKQSHGAFDITVGSAVKLWRRARRTQQLPDEKLLANALQTIGYENLKFDENARTVTLAQPRTRLDLGGIAKGYAADEALRVLKQQGINRALVAASGDIVVGDAPPHAEAWRVAIAPLEVGQPAERYLMLTNAAVSTSGDAFQFVEIDGRRYSHILDPRTGIGLTERVSVTVVAPSGIESDSLASAVCVLGTAAGLKLIESLPQTAVLIVHAGEGKPLEQLSPTMQKLLQSE